jgi:amino acid transporter
MHDRNVSTLTRSVKPRALGKGIHFRQLFTFAFGYLVGFGWIIMTGPWITKAGPGGAALAFLAGGLLLIPIALCYVELATMYPYAGGELLYSYQAFGSGMAFIAGWALLFLFITLTAFETIAAAWIITKLAPPVSGPNIYEVFGFQMTSGMLLIMSGGVVCLTWINVRGSGAMASTQDLLTYGLMIATLAIIIGGGWFGSSENLQPLIYSSKPDWILFGIISVFITTPIWYSGLNALPQALSELREKPAPRRLAGMVVLMLVGSSVFYVLLVLSTGMAAPRSILAEESFATAAAVEVAFDSAAAGNFVLMAGLLGILSTWNAAHFAGARVLFSLGRCQLISPVFGRVHSRYGSPFVAVIFVGAVGMFCALGGTPMIGMIVNVGVIIISVLFLLTCLAFFRLRARRYKDQRPFKIPGYPWLPGFALFYAVCTVVFGLAVTWNGRAPGSIPVEWSILAGWTALGLGLWHVAKPSRNKISERARQQLICYTGE